MATLATALGVRLEKPGVYTLSAGGGLPTVAEANAGIALVDRAAVLAVSVLSLTLVVGSSSYSGGAEPRLSKRSGDRNRQSRRLQSRLPKLLDALSRWG
jgi:adenosylcobinamide-phosphate synthase